MIGKKKYLFAVLFALAIAGSFTACKDDDDNDAIDEWTSNYVYLEPAKLGVSYKELTLAHTSGGVTGDTKPWTPVVVHLHKPCSSDVTVKLAHTVVGTLPEQSISFRSGGDGTLVIPAGELVARDTLDVTTDWNFITRPKATYKVTVQIESITPVANDLRKSTKQNATGMNITKASFLNMSFSTSATLLTGWGTSITNRTPWTVVVQPGVDNAGSPGRLIDGSTSTDVAADNKAFWVTVDLSLTKTVTGIYLRAYGTTYAPRKAEIFTSDDGATWTSQGEIVTSGAAQYFKFLSPVSCRHIKYEILTIASSGRTSITEFYVYAQ